MLQRTSLVAVMISMSMAACGGGGGGEDATAVSANPTAPAASPSPVGSPAPGATPAPAPSSNATPSPGPSNPTPDAPAPTVPGPAVLEALGAGVSEDPAPTNPAVPYRRLAAGPGTYYFLGGKMVSHSQGFGPTGPRPAAVVDIKAQINNGVLTSVEANGVNLEGPSLDLRSAPVPVGEEPANTWTSGSSTASLVVQSVNGEPNLMRVCWRVNLPTSERVEPLKRLMCGVYDIRQPGKDVGGYVEDTIGSNVTAYTGSW